MSRAAEKADDVLFEEVSDTISDISHDIRMEQYDDASKKIELLDKLLKVLHKGGKR